MACWTGRRLAEARPMDALRRRLFDSSKEPAPFCCVLVCNEEMAKFNHLKAGHVRSFAEIVRLQSGLLW